MNKSGDSLGKSGVKKIVAKHLHKSRITGASVQTLRWTFVIRQMISGVDRKFLKKTLGLRDNRSTSLYFPQTYQ